MRPTDEDLVAAYVERGDDKAFRTLVERHQERVYGYLRGMVSDANAAEDLFQDTFMRIIDALHERKGRYATQGKFGAWAIRIARNAALDHLRRQKRWVHRGDGASAPEWDDVADPEPGPSDVLELGENDARLAACIAHLPPEQREVLLLRHEADLTFREIAALTGCSINTALGRMRYALGNLRRLMDATSRGMIRVE